MDDRNDYRGAAPWNGSRSPRSKSEQKPLIRLLFLLSFFVLLSTTACVTPDGGRLEGDLPNAEEQDSSTEAAEERGAGNGTEAGATDEEEPVPPQPSRLPELVVALSFGALVVFFVIKARAGRVYFIRRIPGLEAIDEAIGRATEMGRPILYCPGLDGLDEVATVAAMNILGQVAARVAEYETPLRVPNRDPIVMTVSQEIVREAYNAAGRPDLYDDASIYYVTDSQFGYAAAVCGTMVRERPATNFFFGRFYAESLVLAETGNMTGAIQIAGTDSDAQIPFFITACDYTLIGEELYAGSAYLSREPLLVGTIRAQDIGKVIFIILLIVGSILSFSGVLDIRPFLGKWDAP